MGQTLDIRRPDGATCPAYLSVGDNAANAPAVVVIQEWWGLNDQIKKTADRFAAAGYRALVPDLYRGKLATSAEEASHMMNHLDFLAAADQDIQGCVTHLRASSKRCGVAGFCMGGALTLLAAQRVKGVDVGACFYGMPPKTVFDASKRGASGGIRSRKRAPRVGAHPSLLRRHAERLRGSRPGQAAWTQRELRKGNPKRHTSLGEQPRRWRRT
jgi:dienelactone hydrolase